MNKKQFITFTIALIVIGVSIVNLIIDLVFWILSLILHI